MKKKYINPEMEIISVEHQSAILANSIPYDYNTTKDPSLAEGRGYDDWDDEEDEEW